MIYRATAAIVILFWLTMTVLLLRNEITPGDSALREVPVGHVVKLILHHQQRSDLNIISNKLRLGSLRIDPQIDKVSGARTISFSGTLRFPVPGGHRQPVAWSGEIEMNRELNVRQFRLGVTLHEPEKLRSEIVVRPGENLAEYELSSVNGVLERQSYSLDGDGARAVFQQFGIDPALFPADTLRSSAPPAITAQQSSLSIHGERMDTYRVTVESNGQTWLECHVNQLGQIVRATTLLGYVLAPDDITP